MKVEFKCSENEVNKVPMNSTLLIDLFDEVKK